MIPPDARALEVRVRLSGDTPQRLQRATMSRAAQAGLERKLETRSYRPEAGRYSMATCFDLKTGVIVRSHTAGDDVQRQRAYELTAISGI